MNTPTLAEVVAYADQVARTGCYSGVTAIPPSGGGVVERRLFSLDAVFDEVVPFAV
jgi:hypothetical protein